MEISNKVILPTKEGYYWVKIKGYYDGPKWFPCWYELSEDEEQSFLLLQFGSLNRKFDEIECFGSEIIQPKF